MSETSEDVARKVARFYDAVGLRVGEQTCL